jgi:chromosomal replication initiator protein
MTAFGRAKIEGESLDITVEMRSVNSRFLDPNIKLPRAYIFLEDRLRTRFEGGLIADVQPPNFELRAAIITKKSDAMGLSIDKELIDYLAERLQKDVRQIEGVLKRINAVTSLSGQKVTKEIVDQAISVIDPGNIPTDAMIERILKVVCRHYGISEENIKSKNRTDTVANARHTAIYIIKELTDLTLNEIGNIFGRNHATVIASINKVNTNMRTIKNADADIKRMIKEIKG